VVTRWPPIDQRSCATSDPVSTGMGDRLWTGKPSRYVTRQLGQLEPFILTGSINQVPTCPVGVKAGLSPLLGGR